jgi:hypothetical protein
LVFPDDSGRANALAYHDLTNDGLPLSVDVDLSSARSIVILVTA